MPPKYGRCPDGNVMDSTALLVRVAGGASVMRYRRGESSEKNTTLELAALAIGMIIVLIVLSSVMLLLGPDAAVALDEQLPHLPATVEA
jgi:hypothetical protein